MKTGRSTSAVKLARMLALLGGLIGLSVLAGWAFALPYLKSVLPGAVEMKANTSLGLVLSACALLFIADASAKRVVRAAQGLALAVVLIGGATFLQYAVGWNLGIDELLFRDTATAYNAFRGRMSPYTTVAFVALGVAIASLPHARFGALVSIGAVVVLAIGVLSALGYAWNAGELTTDRFLPPVAIHTAVAFILLSAATLLVHRAKGAETEGTDSMERRVLGGFLGALLLILVASGYTYRSGADFAASAQLVSHSLEVRAALSGAYTAVVDAESAQRDYLLTGDVEHKNRHFVFAGRISDRLDEMARLLARDQARLTEVGELRGLAHERVRLLGRHMQIFEASSNGLGAVRAAIRADDGLAVMARIRGLVQRMDDAEKALIVHRQAAFTRTRELTLLGLLLTLALASGLFFYLFRSIRREIRVRAQAEAEARQANAAKDQFLATMSHEIRTPLNGMLGMLELLALSQLETKQRQHLEAARDSGSGLARIIDDVLDHAKIQAGKLALRAEPVSIGSVVARVMSTYFAVASAKDLTLKEEIDPRLSPAVLADPLRLAQILGNFLSNAIKFTARGTIELRAELVSRSGGAERVRLSVKDPGIGISAEAQRRIFQPFEQAGADTARLYGGTGLGLSISRRLAEMMGGAIGMKSELGKGTTMSLTLTLPIADASAMEAGKAPGREQAAAVWADAPLVLAVDDHPINRRLLAGQLGALGMRVHAVAGGREALELWREARPSLVISDCNMPDMDGYALARAIREAESERGWPRTPIIAWTANVLPSAAAQCRAAGMDDLLTKPADLARLKETVARWIPPTQGGPASIDWRQLESIAPGSAERIEVMQDFLAQTRADVAELEQAVARHDLAAAAQMAHRVKGASRLVGASKLAKVSERLEQAARDAKPHAVASAMAQIRSGLDDVSRDAARFVAQRSAA